MDATPALLTGFALAPALLMALAAALPIVRAPGAPAPWRAFHALAALALLSALVALVLRGLASGNAASWQFGGLAGARPVPGWRCWCSCWAR